MKYSELLAGTRFEGDGRMLAHIPDNWMQGRTTYGGMTAALCLKAAERLSGGRPVRSAQIAFVGPVSGDVMCSATKLREGKNTAFVSTRMHGEDGVSAEAIFAFGNPRESALDHSELPAPEVTSPEDTHSYFGENPNRPHFTTNFNMRLAAGERPVSGAPRGDITLWMRHKDEAAPAEAATLLSIADAPPPAAMSMFKGPGMISSMTWMAEFLTEDFNSEDGWFLARHVAEKTADGYSSQAMTMWDRSGRPVMIGRQTIAVFY